MPPLGPDAAQNTAAYRGWLSRQAPPPVPTTPGAADPITVVMVVRGPTASLLARAIRSVLGQVGAEWRLVVTVVGRPSLGTRWVLFRHGRRARGRITVAVLAAGTSSAAAIRAGSALSGATRVVPLGHHDVLAPDALARLGRSDADVVYADEDAIGGDGQRDRPLLKPDWSPEFLLSSPYLGRPLLFSSSLLEGWSTDDEHFEHDLMLVVSEGARSVEHVPAILYHREHGERPPADRAAVERALSRRGVDARVESGTERGTCRIRRAPGASRVSIIIPFRDQPRFLRLCVDSIRATSADDEVELLLVDNGTTDPETVTLMGVLGELPSVRVLHDDRPFNWASLNNAAVTHATGDVLVFMNNDIEAGQPGWLDALVAQAERADVGAVGARLLYPDAKVQHCGVVIGLGGAAGHVLGGLPAAEPGYLNMAVATRECAAVTGACLAVRRVVFDQLGGFDESLGLDLNDIDFCLRVSDLGLRVIYEAGAELIHYESPSRGTSGNPANIRQFVDRSASLITAGDPYLNPNLTRLDATCGLRHDDEERRWQEWRATLEGM